MTDGNMLGNQDDHDHDDDDDDDDDDNGYPAYSHQSYSHQVGICHNDEWRKYNTVNFPPYLSITRSLGALRAPTSSLGPVGPGLCPSRPSGAQAA